LIIVVFDVLFFSLARCWDIATTGIPTLLKTFEYICHKELNNRERDVKNESEGYNCPNIAIPICSKIVIFTQKEKTDFLQVRTIIVVKV